MLTFVWQNLKDVKLEIGKTNYKKKFGGFKSILKFTTLSLRKAKHFVLVNTLREISCVLLKGQPTPWIAKCPPNLTPKRVSMILKQ